MSILQVTCATRVLMVFGNAEKDVKIRVVCIHNIRITRIPSGI